MSDIKTTPNIWLRVAYVGVDTSSTGVSTYAGSRNLWLSDLVQWQLDNPGLMIVSMTPT